MLRPELRAGTYNEINKEFIRAQVMHHGNTPDNPEMDNVDRLAVLQDTMKDLRLALQQNGNAPSDLLRKKLIQVAMVAGAWIEGIS